MMYRSAAEIVAYVDECAMICPDCVTEEESDEYDGLQPVFLDNNEADTINTCDRCEIPIEGTLTHDGLKYFHSRKIWGDSDRIYGYLLNKWYKQEKRTNKEIGK